MSDTPKSVGQSRVVPRKIGLKNGSYVSAGEVTTLKHELGDDAVERRALVSEALLTGAEGTEVLGGLGDVFVEKIERNTHSLSCWA